MSDVLRECATCTRANQPIDHPTCAACWSKGTSLPLWEPESPDTQRLNWLLPLVTVLDDPTNVGGPRTQALAAALMLGKSGRDAIDYAMEGSP